MPKTIKQKIALREKCNFLLDSVVNLNISLYPELRYIQNLWALGIIDTRYVQNEGNFVIDRFSEEPYDTVVRILPKIMDLINNKFPKEAEIYDKIERANIFSGLERLNLARKTSDFKLELIPKE